MPTALLSVHDKTGIADFARGLHGVGWTHYASGGTRDRILDGYDEIRVFDTSVLTGSGSRFGHRVVTLSVQIANALLAPDTKEARAELEAEGIPFIDMVVVDPYPTHRFIADGATPDVVNENTDVGGPTMIAEALKGGRWVICDPHDYTEVLRVLSMQEIFPEDDPIGAADRSRNPLTRQRGLQDALQRKARLFLAGYHAVLAWYYNQPPNREDTHIGRMLLHFRTDPGKWPTTASFFCELGAQMCQLGSLEATPVASVRKP